MMSLEVEMRLIFSFLLLTAFAWGEEQPVRKGGSLQSLYTSLDPTSVAQHFAFYELYPDTPLGKQALRHAWDLLHGSEHPEVLPSIDLHPMIAFVNRPPNAESAPVLPEEQLQTIEKLSRHLKNRPLKGFGIWDSAALESLPSEEIDLARGLFLSEMNEDNPAARQKVRSYEAQIDLMALQILARLPEQAAPKDKIRAINDYIFGEMRFRFPPHSLWAKDIDVYTFLPSVLDSRRGVCLGVSILYLCLAQRLDLQLEAITPPGHIFVRLKNHETNDTVNIETTARGIDIPDEVYLGIETRKLQQRTIREVIGLAFMNQASVSWHREDYPTTIKLYEKASRFLPDDYLLNMFRGFTCLFAGRIEEGKTLLKKVQGKTPDHMISADGVSEDYLSGKTDAAGIQGVYAEIDEKRSSILDKQKKLTEIVARYPSFRQGHLHLAITYLQLGRQKEALPILERYIALSPNDPTANYYLSAIHFQRFNYKEAWKYLQRAEKIVFEKDHHPRALQELREELQRACPEPKISLQSNEA
jgi:regulator of sirC expression with transglutaminase-like and TPR domain